MAFDITTFCANDWQFLDDVVTATFEPADGSGGLGTTYTDTRVLYSPINYPEISGGRTPISGQHSLFEFWKAGSTTAPDPKINDHITVDSVLYVIDSVTDTRRSKWMLTVTKAKTNTPAT